MKAMSQTINKKICLLGEFGVGKTSLIRRFVYDRFSDEYITTIGVKVSKKMIPPIEKKGKIIQYRFMIWDISGSENGQMKYEGYMTGASGAIVVADLCRPETLSHSKSIIEKFMIHNPKASIIVVGNKSDLIDNSEYSLYENSLKEISRSYHSPIFLTSAKIGWHVEETFIRLAEIMTE